MVWLNVSLTRQLVSVLAGFLLTIRGTAFPRVHALLVTQDLIMMNQVNASRNELYYFTGNVAIAAVTVSELKRFKIIVIWLGFDCLLSGQFIGHFQWNTGTGGLIDFMLFL